MDIRTFNANETTSTTQSQMESLGPPPALISNPAQENSVNDHAPAQQVGGNHVPTDGAREATPPKPPTPKELEQMADERLCASPEYQELAAKLEALKAAEIDFALVDEHTLGAGDNIISIQDLRVLIADPFADPGAKAAANRLMNNKALWNELASGVTGVNDNKVGANDIGRLKGDTKAAMSSLKDVARAEIKGELGAAANAATAAGGGAGAATGSTSGGAESSPLFKAPAPSTKPGMEGAVENVNNTLLSIGNAVAELSAQLADPKLTPEKRAELQARFNELQQLQSMLTNMYKQLQEAIANMMKMYSDVAQNSIRNMK